MKFILLLPFVTLYVSAFSVKSGDIIDSAAVSLTDQELVDYVNRKQNYWRAELPNVPIESLRRRLMDVKYVAPPPKEYRLRAPKHEISDADIPASFDARQQWPDCPSISFIRDQSECGACWSFAAVESMSDRHCIHSDGKTIVELSALDVLSCCQMPECGFGCLGGYPIKAWEYWVKNGVVTGSNYGDKNTCRPYTIPPCGHHANQTYYGPCVEHFHPETPKCEKSCQKDYPTAYQDDKHWGVSAYAIDNNVAAIQKEIMTNGPVEAGYTVYEDFYSYKSGIYVHTSGREVGGHAVRIIGWGSEGATPYWLIANSWNSDWGENGYFRILRGVNMCGIEQDITAGMPKV